MQRRIPHLSAEEMEKIAEEFLRNRGNAATPPIEIDLILEQSGFNIVPIPNLSRDFDIDGWLSCDMKHIYIDAYIYGHEMNYRYRFTLAHECAHSIAHRNIFIQLGFLHFTQADSFYRGLNQSEYNSLEFQANTIGGLLLIPTSDLKKKIEELNINHQLDMNSKLQIAVHRLKKRYKVSDDVIRIRIKNLNCLK